jgi:hypothetical protein
MQDYTRQRNRHHAANLEIVPAAYVVTALQDVGMASLLVAGSDRTTPCPIAVTKSLLK